MQTVLVSSQPGSDDENGCFGLVATGSVVFSSLRSGAKSGSLLFPHARAVNEPSATEEMASQGDGRALVCTPWPSVWRYGLGGVEALFDQLINFVE